MTETVLDVKHMTCPLPVLRANRALRGLQPGDRLRVLSTDRASVADFKAYCRETGHALLASSEEAGVFAFVIRCRAAAAAPNDTPDATPDATPGDTRADTPGDGRGGVGP